jgi:hypothetical protein
VSDREITESHFTLNIASLGAKKNLLFSIHFLRPDLQPGTKQTGIIKLLPTINYIKKTNVVGLIKVTFIHSRRQFYCFLIGIALIHTITNFIDFLKKFWRKPRCQYCLVSLREASQFQFIPTR